MANTKIDVRGTQFLDDNGNLYYGIDMGEAKNEINYNLQLFFTSIGINKYHFRPNTPALRLDLGGQPSFLVKINITLPENNKVIVVPFIIQNIRGSLKITQSAPYSACYVEFIVGKDLLATGYLDFGRIYITAPQNPKDIALKKKEGEEKRKTRKLYLERKFKNLGGSKLSKAEINALQDIRRQWVSSDSNAVKKLLAMRYIYKRGILSSKYALTEDGEDLLNWLLQEY